MAEQGQQLTEEDLKNMSPEQIRELQKQNCIFCHIISGKVASKKVYEDEKSIAILDINPANPGHILLLPKEHYAIMPLMPEDEITHLSIIAKKLSHALLKALKVQGTNIFIANGAIAGQKAPHFMMHIIPRKEKDGLSVFDIPKNKVSEEDLKKIQDALKKKINELFGLKSEEVEEAKEEPKGEKKEEKEPKPEKKEEPKEEEKEPGPKKEPEPTPEPEKTPEEKQEEEIEEHAKELEQKGETVNLDDIADLFK